MGNRIISDMDWIRLMIAPLYRAEGIYELYDPEMARYYHQLLRENGYPEALLVEMGVGLSGMGQVIFHPDKFPVIRAKLHRNKKIYHQMHQRACKGIRQLDELFEEYQHEKSAATA